MKVQDLTDNEIGSTFNNGSYNFEILELVKRTNKTLKIKYMANGGYYETSMRLSKQIVKVK